jgi:hypothetical protein
MLNVFKKFCTSISGFIKGLFTTVVESSEFQKMAVAGIQAGVIAEPKYKAPTIAACNIVITEIDKGEIIPIPDLAKLAKDAYEKSSLSVTQKAYVSILFTIYMPKVKTYLSELGLPSVTSELAEVRKITVFIKEAVESTPTV